jgi:hypothetical protein
MTTTVARAPRRAWWQLIGYLAKRATVAEIHGYLSNYRFVFRRPKVPAGAVGFGYHQPILSVLIVFVVLSAVELVAVDLIVRRWTYVRIPLLVLSVWGIVWMLGLLFGLLTRPHAVGPDGIRVRFGAEIDIGIDWLSVDAVAIRRRNRVGKAPKVTLDDHGEATLHVRVANETNLEIELDRPAAVRLPHGTETVRRISLYADDPKAFLAEVRRHVG